MSNFRPISSEISDSATGGNASLASHGGGEGSSVPEILRALGEILNMGLVGMFFLKKIIVV